jgi:hypothetical protein
MIKAFFLIFEPSVAWERLGTARRSFGFVFATYLLPTVIFTVAVESWGLMKWGKWQPKFQKVADFSTGSVITLGVIQVLMFLAMAMVCALVLLRISQTFQGHRTCYRQAFTTVAYGFSPLFVAHLMNAAPMMNPWVPWCIGILLVIWILYQGIPRVMQPDPTHAFGLYLSMVLVMLLTSGIVIGLPALYLLGQVDFHHSWLTHKFPGLFQ